MYTLIDFLRKETVYKEKIIHVIDKYTLPVDDLWGKLATANQNMIAVVSNKLNTQGNLDLTTEIYPNPSNSVFNIKMISSSKAPALLSIVNNAGSIIYSRRINAGTYYQLGQDLKPGIYYINIRQGTQIKTMKVVKQ